MTYVDAFIESGLAAETERGVVFVMGNTGQWWFSAFSQIKEFYIYQCAVWHKHCKSYRQRRQYNPTDKYASQCSGTIVKIHPTV